MSKKLDVYFEEELIGELIQDEYGDLAFAYNHTWLNNPHALPLSCSLPLQKETFDRKQCTAFFEGLLPEQNHRKQIAKILGISAHNDFSMLEKIGGECAGAISFMPLGEKLETIPFQYHELREKELAQILQELPKKPLLAGERGVRLSLAGAQDKLAVYVSHDTIFLPFNHAPSSHILKPAYGQYENIVFNEEFCLRLAKIAGLSVANAEIRHVENMSYLLVERYDRVEINGQIKRIHQEDFCQALGIPVTKKYQNEQGLSLKQCFELIKNQTTTPVLELEKLLQAAMFNFIIGNCDAHGKNFSLLYGEKIKFSPLYDLICTIFYPNLDKKMAMKLGGEYHIENIRLRHIEKFSEEMNLSKTEIKKKMYALIEKILMLLKNIEIKHETQKQISEIITQRCQGFITSIFS